MLIAMVAALACGFSSIEVAVQTADGTIIEGTIELEQLQMKTNFGQATIDADRISSITFDQPQIVITSDQTKLKGKLELQSLSIRRDDGDTSLPIEQLKSLDVIRRAELKAGEVTSGISRNKVSYCVRGPTNTGKTLNAIVILHGSNMNSRMYVDTMVAQWPDIANRYVLIGINGEQHNPQSPADNPTYNYTYINFMGKSKHKGYPGTDRESPALVAEVIRELRDRFEIDKLYVGGHSQGGFLTYSILMNYPELIDGAFPISAGLIFQCDPSAYEDAELRAAQRTIPLIIVHGTNDPNVDFGMGRSAYEQFEDGGFPAVRLMTSDNAGHRFALLPLDHAISWLELMSSDDAAAIHAAALEKLKAGEIRDASVLANRLAKLDQNAEHSNDTASLREQLNQQAKAEADRLLLLLTANADNRWVDDYLAFRERYGLLEVSNPVIETYQQLRAVHQEPADELFNAARSDFQGSNQDAGYAKCQAIVETWYGSSWYRTCKRWLAQRK
jgi:predicted esterase